MGKRKAIEQIVKRQKRLRNTERIESTSKSDETEDKVSDPAVHCTALYTTVCAVV